MALELLLVLPLLLTLLFAMIQFSLLLSSRQVMLAASQEGARVAAQGGDAAEVETATRRVLGNGALSQARVVVQVTDSSGNPLPSGDPVTVCVQLNADQAAPNLLRFIGLNIQEPIVACTTLRKE
jgi:Flp pilus assembly protein TadG